MTAQEIFTAVWNHFVVGGAPRSILHDDVCAYRGDNGARCAVGVLLSDDEYAPRMEGKAIRMHPQILPERLRPHTELLVHLQDIHDASSDDTIRDAFVRFAANNTFGVHAP